MGYREMSPRQRDAVHKAGAAARWAQKRAEHEREMRLVQGEDGGWYDPQEQGATK